jgi:UDP-glucose 4-epimerase
MPLIVLFGGAGYVGRTLAEELVKRGHDVVIADLPGSQPVPQTRFHGVDIRNAEAVADCIEPGSYVVNLAAVADINVARSQPHECIEINIMGNLNILEGCVKKGAARFVYASTAYVYSAHGSFYRITKRTAEEYTAEYHRRHNLDFLILRYGSLYGGYSNNSNGMHRLISSAVKQGRLYYEGLPTDTREFIHVEDAAALAADLLIGRERNRAYLLTGGERITMQSLFEMIREILSRPIIFEFGCRSDSDHYRQTQYNFVPIEARKISRVEHVDLGNGLISLVNRVYVQELDTV